MEIKEIIDKLDSIRDDTYWTSGCTDSDTLKSGLEEAERRLAELIAELSESIK